MKGLSRSCVATFILPTHTLPSLLTKNKEGAHASFEVGIKKIKVFCKSS